MVALPFVACRKGAGEAPKDAPQLTPKVTMQDVTLYSRALRRDMPYRVVLPTNSAPGKKLKAVYLLHGGGGNFRDWTNDYDVAKYAEHGLILVMPEGHMSWYVNAAERPQDRYEDFIVKDLIEDVESRFPVANHREDRAIVGISMGGYGAINLTLRHPDLYAFAGGMSATLDIATRPFPTRNVYGWREWRRNREIFGPWDGSTQKANDPFLLVTLADTQNAPYFFLTCGEQEGLLELDRRFASLLEARHFQYAFHTTPGDHNRKQWDEWLPKLFQSIEEHLSMAADVSSFNPN